MLRHVDKFNHSKQSIDTGDLGACVGCPVGGHPPEPGMSVGGGLLRRRPSARRRDAGRERGSATVEVLMAMGTALALTVLLVNALLMLYARSVIQHAADVGARSAARSGGSASVCETLITATIGDLASLYRDDTAVQCSRGATTTTATVSADLDPVFPDLGPGWSFTIRATTATEPAP